MSIFDMGRNMQLENAAIGGLLDNVEDYESAFSSALNNVTENEALQRLVHGTSWTRFVYDETGTTDRPIWTRQVPHGPGQLVTYKNEQYAAVPSSPVSPDKDEEKAKKAKCGRMIRI